MKSACRVPTLSLISLIPSWNFSPFCGNTERNIIASHDFLSPTSLFATIAAAECDAKSCKRLSETKVSHVCNSAGERGKMEYVAPKTDDEVDAGAITLMSVTKYEFSRRQQRESEKNENDLHGGSSELRAKTFRNAVARHSFSPSPSPPFLLPFRAADQIPRE